MCSIFNYFYMYLKVSTLQFTNISPNLIKPLIDFLTKFSKPTDLDSVRDWTEASASFEIPPAPFTFSCRSLPLWLWRWTVELVSCFRCHCQTCRPKSPPEVPLLAKRSGSNARSVYDFPRGKSAATANTKCNKSKNTNRNGAKQIKYCRNL